MARLEVVIISEVDWKVEAVIQPERGDGPGEFDFLLAQLKSIPSRFRDYDPDRRVWTVYNSDQFVEQVPAIKSAIADRRSQLRLF